MFGMKFSFIMTPRICFQSVAFSLSSKQTDSRASLTGAGGFAIDLTSAKCFFLIELTAIHCFHHQFMKNYFDFFHLNFVFLKINFRFKS